MHTLENRVAIITGATGNLGLAVARAFQHAGAHTVLVDHGRGRLREQFAEIADSPGHLLLEEVNLSDPPAVARVAERARERFGRIDVLVHTVGTWRGGKPVHETPLEEWTFLHDTNLRTTLLAARAVIPQMLAQRSGRIVTVSARGGLAGAAGSAAYSAVKSAVLRLTESLSAELKESGINVNAVLPSMIDTPQNRAAMPDADFARWVEPVAIADVILFLASDAARAIHGATIPVFGLS